MRREIGDELVAIADDKGIHLRTIYSVLKRNGLRPAPNKPH
jgi:hypothetical protein